LGLNNIYFVDYSNYNYDFRFSYQLNDSLLAFESISTVVLVGCHLRLEAPLLNIRLRKNFLNNSDFLGYSFGLSLNFLTFPVINISNSIRIFIMFLEGKLNSFSFLRDFFNLSYFNYTYSLGFLLGASYLKRIDTFCLISSLFSMVSLLPKQIFSFNFISRFLGRLTSNELGLMFNRDVRLLQTKTNSRAIIYLCGLDSVDFNFMQESTGIFQGCFFDFNFTRYVVVFLPVAIYTESELFFINLEGRLRSSAKAIVSLNENFPD